MSILILIGCIKLIRDYYNNTDKLKKNIYIYIFFQTVDARLSLYNSCKYQKSHKNFSLNI